MAVRSRQIVVALDGLAAVVGIRRLGSDESWFTTLGWVAVYVAIGLVVARAMRGYSSNKTPWEADGSDLAPDAPERVDPAS